MTTGSKSPTGNGCRNAEPQPRSPNFLARCLLLRSWRQTPTAVQSSPPKLATSILREQSSFDCSPAWMRNRASCDVWEAGSAQLHGRTAVRRRGRGGLWSARKHHHASAHSHAAIKVFDVLIDQTN